MFSRRELLLISGQAALALACSGCSGKSPLLRKDIFPEFGEPGRPYLGLATSLHEEHSYEARVEGAIPRELRGTLFRNGPGLFDRGGLRKRNLLDGDGMVQSFRFHEQGVHYRNRFVATDKYRDEERAGRFLYPSWSTQAPGGFWNNFPGGRELRSQAGITVFPWQGRLYAFDECSHPYELNPDTLETIGPSYLGLPKELTIYAAHAKFDPRTGEWLHFGIAYGPRPKLHLTIFGRDGRLGFHRTIPMPRNIYMHDWSVSDRHLILTLHPVEIAFWEFLLGQRSLAESLTWKPERGNLVMVIERGSNADPVLLEAPARYMWHSFNAWEQGGEIVSDFIGYDNPDHFVGSDPVVTAVMSGRAGHHLHPGRVRRYLIDPRSGRIREEIVSEGNYEWPRIHEQFRGSRYRHGYMVGARPGEFFWSSVCRIDMTSGAVRSYDFGTGTYCSEPVFVPLPGHSYAGGNGEEPGWLMTEVYDSRTMKSHLALLRSDRVKDGPFALVRLEHHVPFSYHGWWSPGA